VQHEHDTRGDHRATGEEDDCPATDRIAGSREDQADPDTDSQEQVVEALIEGERSNGPCRFVGREPEPRSDRGPREPQAFEDEEPDVDQRRDDGGHDPDRMHGGIVDDRGIRGSTWAV
jgi:hypothetical protein